ncbi:MAG: glycosyltransferase [Betaproteobacteria bacterium]|nr:glycosyltransferase [Betaproteobacteria bacterium]
MNAPPGFAGPTLRRFLGALRRAWRRTRGGHGAGSRTYPEWLARRIAARAARYPASAAPVRFSLLTTVYERTDAGLLRETALCLRGQSLPFHEWIVLAHGPVPEGLDRLLDELAADVRVRTHRLPENLGIAGGMRFCLEAATGDYAVPVDADDLLTPDALQVFDSAIASHGGPALLYSDEDILVGGVPSVPYWRPDWDPVLNLASSYIWHLCAFRREEALARGVYSDSGCNWCHDWDTITRFANAGHAPVHVPEILYHWRHHAASSTNRASPEKGSLDSTRHLLEQQIARQRRPDWYQVSPFPIYRGMAEWHIGRRRAGATPMDVVLLARSPNRALLTLASIGKRSDYPFRSVVLCIPEDADAAAFRRLAAFAAPLCQEGKAAAPAAPDVKFVQKDGVAGLGVALGSATAPLVLLCSDAVELAAGEGPWEALKLMEFFPDIAMACGRLADGSGKIREGGIVFGDDGVPVDPFRGRRLDDGGAFALALKPHTVSAPGLDLMVADREFLVAALAALPENASLGAAALWLGGAALDHGRRVAFSPLIGGVVKGRLLTADFGAGEAGDEVAAFRRAYGGRIKPQLLSFIRLSGAPDDPLR